MKISEVMTPISHSLRPTSTIREAEIIMIENQIRHLPVLSPKGKILGLVSDRDLKLAKSLLARDSAAVEILVEEAPFTVNPETELIVAVKEMYANKYGCVIVENAIGEAVGIFTKTDALRVLAHVLGSKNPNFSLGTLLSNAFRGPEN